MPTRTVSGRQSSKGDADHPRAPRRPLASDGSKPAAPYQRGSRSIMVNDLMRKPTSSFGDVHTRGQVTAEFKEFAPLPGVPLEKL
jgi:hypothetical protein